jgi:8-oxo-dGTP pyrophosphatase MutT (NUDIX family)
VLLHKIQVWVYRRETASKTPKFLILHTNPKRGAFWQPVTGSVEKGELPEAAALREAREETGLEGKLIPLNHSFKFEARGNTYEEFGFALEISQENFSENAVKIDSLEHDGFEWVNAQQAEKKIRFNSNKEMLRLLTVKMNESIIA